MLFKVTCKSASKPEENFGGNDLLHIEICLSLLYPGWVTNLYRKFKKMYCSLKTINKKRKKLFGPLSTEEYISWVHKSNYF